MNANGASTFGATPFFSLRTDKSLDAVGFDLFKIAY
jgi:hypothetical protein